MREPPDAIVAELPYWIADTLRRDIVSTASARRAIMDRVRCERPRPLSTPSRPSRWPRRGALTPLALLGVLGVVFVATSLRDVHRRIDLTVMNSAQLIGDSVVPSPDHAAGPGEHNAFLDTLHIVEFVLRGGAVRSAVVVGDFNAWQRGTTPLHRDADGNWRARALVPRDALRYAYVIDNIRIIAPPPLTVVRDATRMRHDSI